MPLASIQITLCVLSTLIVMNVYVCWFNQFPKVLNTVGMRFSAYILALIVVDMVQRT